jgi:hypothetical protein
VTPGNGFFLYRFLGMMNTLQPAPFSIDSKCDIAEKPCSSGAKAPDFQLSPATAGLFSRIYPALLIVGGFIPRRRDIFSDLNV